MDRWTLIYRMTWLAVCVVACGCASTSSNEPIAELPSVTPTTRPASSGSLELDASRIRPMYTEILAVDLAAVIETAAADNLDIHRARQEVEAMRGRSESALGAAFPVIVPTALFEHVEGTVRATQGNLVNVGFANVQPSVAVQWVLNPGRVIHGIIAAKKRLAASQHQAHAVVVETLRSAAVQYYELILMQARVSATTQAVTEAEELRRINALRVRNGTGVPADELRADARLAERRQDLTLAMNALYEASVSLAVTLRLDAATTLIPSIQQLPPIHLVRDDFSVDQLMELAVDHRPDLKSLRELLAAVAQDKDATWWGAFGPQLQVGYRYGGITGHANNTDAGAGIPGNLIINPLSANGSFSGNPLANGVIREAIARGSRRAEGDSDETFGFSDQQRFSAGSGWRLSLAAFGDLKTAGAMTRQTAIDLERRIDQVRARIVRSDQASKTNDELIRLARQQIAAAAEALRLSQANLQAGTMTTLDVLQAQDAVAQARLRNADAVVRFNQSQVNLLAALGLLDKSSLLMTPVAE